MKRATIIMTLGLWVLIGFCGQVHAQEKQVTVDSKEPLK